MRAEEIIEEETLEAWLQSRPKADALAIAHRAAMRVLPLWGAEMGADWAREESLTTLPLLRAGLISAVAGMMPAVDVKHSSSAAFSAASGSVLAATKVSAARASAANAARSASASAHTSALSARAASASSVRAATLAAAPTVSAAASVRSSSFGAIQLDASRLEVGQKIWPTVLFPVESPTWFEKAEAEMLAIWDGEPKDRWAFWRRWWDGVKTGDPLPAALQLAIVQGLEDADWDDPGRAAARIAEIEEQYRLLTEVRALKEELRAVQAAAASAQHRSHNQPPELVEDVAVTKAITILWEELEVAEDVLSQPNPEPSKLREVGQALLQAARAILAYCGKVGDAFVMKAATTLGETGVKWAVRGATAVSVDKATGIGQGMVDLAARLMGAG